MEQPAKSLSANQAWEQLLERYSIAKEVKLRGCYHIKASQIKEYREPRLMAKWDTSESLPKALKDAGLNILADSRSSYVIGDFLLYEKFPQADPGAPVKQVRMPRYQSIDGGTISSEAGAINVLVLSGILDDFLQEGANTATFNGRMGTGAFEFQVNTSSGIPRRIQVNNAQCEIDGGFENEHSVVILEAKNVLHEDFHVRQLYYPYRLWQSRVKKPVRLVFSVYSNQIFRLFEYRFRSLEDYSSIQLVQAKRYSLQDTRITVEELRRVRARTPIGTDDNMCFTRVPFVQANSMERVVSLLENLAQTPMTPLEIARLMEFDPRQSDYYYNAGRYLGLFQKSREDKQVQISLTALGRRIFELPYQERQLELVGLILRHQIFAHFFDRTLQLRALPPAEEIMGEMRRLQVCREGQIPRRAGSVLGWLRWIFGLTQE